MVKDEYSRYEFQDKAGVIASANAPILYDPNNPKQVICAGLEEVLVWDIRTGALAHSLRDAKCSSQVTALIAPSPRFIISGYEDGSIRVWEDYELKVVFSGHRSAVTAFAFDSGNERLASGGRDSDIVVWDLVALAGLFRLKGHSHGITTLHFIGYSLVVSGARDSLLKVWELKTQLCVHTCTEHKGFVSDFCLTPDERTLISVGEDNQVRIFALDPELLVKVVQDAELLGQGFSLVGQCQRFGKERALAVKLHGSSLAVLSAEKLVEFFEIRTADQLKRKLKRKQKSAGEEETAHLSPADLLSSRRILRFDCRAFSFEFKSEEEILVGLSDNQVVEYKVPKESEQEAKAGNRVWMAGHRGAIKNVVFSPNADYLATVSVDSVKLWDPESFKCNLTVELEGQTGQSLVFLCAGTIAVGCKSGDLLLVDVPTASVTQTMEATGSSTQGITHLHIQDRMLVGSCGQQVRFWEVKPATGDKPLRLKPLKTLQLNETAGALCLSPDTKLVAVAFLDLTIKVFFTDTLKFYLNLYGHKLPVNCLDIASDNRTLISGSTDKNIKVWGLDFGDLRRSIFAHQDAVTAVKFIPESTLFFSSGKDGLVKFWNARNFEPLMKLEGTGPAISGLALTPDTIVAAGVDLRCWRKSEEPLFPEEEQKNEMDALLEEELIAENPFVKQDDEEAALKATKKTIVAIKASERLMEALEAADQELMRLEAGGVEPKSTLFIALSQGCSPAMTVVNAIERIDFADLEEAMITLPSRLLPSLLRHIREALGERSHNLGTPLVPIMRCMLLVMKIFYRELAVDRPLQLDLQEIMPKLQAQLFHYREVMASNMSKLSALDSKLHISSTQ